MRLVVREGPGQLGLNYMWLPTWIGMNVGLVRKIEEKVGPSFIGKDLTDEVLDEVHEKILEFLKEEFPNIPGLFDYIDGLKFVEAG